MRCAMLPARVASTHIASDSRKMYVPAGLQMVDQVNEMTTCVCMCVLMVRVRSSEANAVHICEQERIKKRKKSAR